jgi:hypothetical protein
MRALAFTDTTDTSDTSKPSRRRSDIDALPG